MKNRPNTERRDFAGKIERRASEDGSTKINGYAAVFDSYSENLGGFREIIRPGAFAKSLQDGADVRAMYEHRSDALLGRTSSGTLRLDEDADGLRSEIDVADTQSGRDVLTLVDRGDLTGMSFGFYTRSDNWHRDVVDGESVVVRELLEVEVFDVSVVAFPAYPDTSVALRSRDLAGDESLESDPDFERIATELRMRPEELRVLLERRDNDAGEAFAKMLRDFEERMVTRLDLLSKRVRIAESVSP